MTLGSRQWIGVTEQGQMNENGSELARLRFRRRHIQDDAELTEIVRLMLHELNGQVDASLRLQEISTLLIQEGNLDALYERVLDAAICLMSADVGSMQKYDPEQDQLRLLASRGFNPESIAFWDRVYRAFRDQLRHGVVTGTSGHCVRHRMFRFHGRFD